MADLIDLGAKLELDGLTQFLRGMKQVAVATGAAAEKNAKLAAQRQRTANFFAAVTAASTATTAALRATGAAFNIMSRGASVAFQAVEKYADFDTQIARVASLLPESAGLMGELNGEVSKLAITFGQDGADAAGAFFDAISSGIDRADAEEFTGTAAKLAVAGFTDVNTTVLGLTKTINGFGLSAKEAEKVADAFFITNKLGATTIAEISRGIGQVAPSAKALGLSYEELLAVTAAMTKGGIDTSTTFASLKQVFSNVLKPTKEASDTAKRLGINFSASALKAKGYAGFMADIAAKTKGSADAQSALFGSMESFNAAATVTSAGGAKDLNEALRQMGGRAGTVAHEFSRVSETVGFKIRQLKVGMEQFSVSAGAGLVEGLGLDQLASDVPETMAEINATAQSSARAFGDAFKGAFEPFGDVEKVPWETIANRMGEAAGRISTAMAIMARTTAGAVGTVLDLYDMITGAASPAEKARAGRFMTAQELKDSAATNWDNWASDWLADRAMVNGTTVDGKYSAIAGGTRDADAAEFLKSVGRVVGPNELGKERVKSRRALEVRASNVYAENGRDPSFYNTEEISGSRFDTGGQTLVPDIAITRNLTIVVPDGQGGTQSLTSTTKDNLRGTGNAMPVRTREARAGVTVDDELERAGGGH